MAGITMEKYLEDEKQTIEEFEADLERRVRDDLYDLKKKLDLPGLATEPTDVSAPSWPGADWRERAAWVPDLVYFGKVVGGGMPLAVYGGRADIMGHLAPDGPVYQAGTLSGNPVAVAAGLASLRAADAEVYAKLGRNATALGDLMTQALTAEGVEHRVQYAGTLVSVFFTENTVTNYDEAKAAQTWRFPAFFHALLSRGVYPPPSAFEAWFVTAAHDDDVIARIADALPAAARAAAG